LFKLTALGLTFRFCHYVEVTGENKKRSFSSELPDEKTSKITYAVESSFSVNRRKK